jgi:hypothetical protein
MTNFTNTPFFRNTLACITAGIIGAIVIMRIGRHYVPQMPFIIIIALACIYLLASIGCIFVWKGKSNKEIIDNAKTQAFWEGSIRCFIALDMLMFGVGKIFHQQFRVPVGLFDNPFNSLDNDMLLWAFFGKFYWYTVIIALLQITSGSLLLFRKTRLLGLFFLLPILFNIILLNFFYDFGLIVDGYTIMLTLAAIYLLLLEYDRLVQIFFNAKSQLPVFEFKQNGLKAVIRLAVVCIPLALIGINRYPLFYPDYTGKYVVKNLSVNGIVIQRPQSSRDSVLSNIFIDRDDNDFVLEYNDYRRRLIGTYTYNEAKKQFKVVWRYPQNQHDTLFARLLPGTKLDTKILEGRMGKEIFKIDFLKVRY